MSGKTQLLIQILNNVPQLFDRGSAVKKVVYCYGSPWQNGFDELERDHGIVFHTGIPENMQSLFNENNKPGILILDDLQLEMENSSALAPLVTKGTYHSDLCTILVFQTLFSLGRQSVQVRSNLHSNIFFNFPNERRQLSIRLQDFTTSAREKQSFQRFFAKWMREYKYMIIDNHPKSDKELSIRTQILPTDRFTIVLKRKTRNL